MNRTLLVISASIEGNSFNREEHSGVVHGYNFGSDIVKIDVGRRSKNDSITGIS